MHSLYSILVMGTNVLGGDMKMGNSVPRPGIESTSIAFRASVQTNMPCRLPDVTLPTPTCVYGSLPERSGGHIGRDLCRALVNGHPSGGETDDAVMWSTEADSLRCTLIFYPLPLAQSITSSDLLWNHIGRDQCSPMCYSGVKVLSS